MIFTTFIAIRKYAKELLKINDIFGQEELWEFLIDKDTSIRSIINKDITFSIVERKDIIIITYKNTTTGQYVEEYYNHHDYMVLVRYIDKLLIINLHINDNDTNDVVLLKHNINNTKTKISYAHKHKKSNLYISQLIDSYTIGEAKSEIENIFNIQIG